MSSVLKALFMALAVPVAQGAVAHAQRAPARYRPSVGQLGKDAVWVPTPEALVARILTMANVTETDRLIDLGSGDGRVVIAAARQFGVRALGIEYDPELVALSRRNAHDAGVAERVKFVEADLFEADLSGADVVAMYLMPHLNMRLRPKLLQLRPGTRVISQSFGMGDWRADAQVMRDGRAAYLWIVPAQVAREWDVTHDDGGECMRLTLTQRHQFVAGEAHSDGASLKLRKTRLSGAWISFVVVGAGGKRAYVGEIDGDRMMGAVDTADGRRVGWSASRRGNRELS